MNSNLTELLSELRCICVEGELANKLCTYRGSPEEINKLTPTELLNVRSESYQRILDGLMLDKVISGSVMSGHWPDMDPTFVAQYSETDSHTADAVRYSLMIPPAPRRRKWFFVGAILGFIMFMALVALLGLS